MALGAHDCAPAGVRGREVPGASRRQSHVREVTWEGGPGHTEELWTRCRFVPCLEANWKSLHVLSKAMFWFTLKNITFTLAAKWKPDEQKGQETS